MGIAGAFWSEDDVMVFFNKSLHKENIPIDYISLHFYSGCSKRNDSSTYHEFFERAELKIIDFTNFYKRMKA